MQALEVAQKITAKGGEVVKQAVGPDTVAVTAVNSADGSYCSGSGYEWCDCVDSACGKLDGDGGGASVQDFATRSDTNPKRVKDGSQSLEDYMDPAATKQYLEFTHEQYKKAVGDEFGKTIMGFRGDEPDYSIAGLPWTPKFFERFEQVKGYDIRPYVAAFLQPKGTALTETQRRARRITTMCSRRCFATASSSRRESGARPTVWSTRCI